MVRRFDTDQHTTPFLKALDTLRREASRQGEHLEHVAAIVMMIDQYCEAAVRDRRYFCDAPLIFAPGRSIT